MVATGASAGLGLALVREAALRGFEVLSMSRTRPPDDVTWIPLDVRDAGRVEASFARLHLGPDDIVINNAGAGLFGTVEESTQRELERLFQTNFFAATSVTRAAIAGFRRGGGGRLVQISSVAAAEAAPGLGIYAASKAALEAMSASAREEVAEFGIEIMIVRPGPMDTGWAAASPASTQLPHYHGHRAARERAVAQMRFADPSTVARRLLSLLSEASPLPQLVTIRD